MDKNRLYCHFIVSIYKITKIIDYNPSKMDYNPSVFYINIIHYNRLKSIIMYFLRTNYEFFVKVISFPVSCSCYVLRFINSYFSH